MGIEHPTQEHVASHLVNMCVTYVKLIMCPKMTGQYVMMKNKVKPTDLPR